MSKRSKRADKAMDIVLQYVDLITDYHETPDFVEVIGESGGDVITHRVYDDGTVTEK